MIAPVEEEESESEDEIPIKRNPDTVHKNHVFDRSMRARSQGGVTDFMQSNRQTIRELSTGRPLKLRIEVPEGVEVYPYGAQRGNIWEQQKE
jgi:hypothetical protein